MTTDRDTHTPSTRPKVSVIMPAYNEGALIGDSVHQVADYLAGIEAKYDWEILVVDDGAETIPAAASGRLVEIQEFASLHIQRTSA